MTDFMGEAFKGAIERLSEKLVEFERAEREVRKAGVIVRSDETYVSAVNEFDRMNHGNELRLMKNTRDMAFYQLREASHQAVEAWERRKEEVHG